MLGAKNALPTQARQVRGGSRTTQQRRASYRHIYMSKTVARKGHAAQSGAGTQCSESALDTNGRRGKEKSASRAQCHGRQHCTALHVLNPTHVGWCVRQRKKERAGRSMIREKKCYASLPAQRPRLPCTDEAPALAARVCGRVRASRPLLPFPLWLCGSAAALPRQTPPTPPAAASSSFFLSGAAKEETAWRARRGAARHAPRSRTAPPRSAHTTSRLPCVWTATTSTVHLGFPSKVVRRLL